MQAKQGDKPIGACNECGTLIFGGFTQLHPLKAHCPKCEKVTTVVVRGFHNVDHSPEPQREVKKF